ncbi:DUF305 domain-containing protein [Streptomyces subrutilus]|uniref:DUF305 domain-containing protein n=1 Tax=Streptomyces subrutilus TaxID=36818 RepID=A0A1E5PZD3_9ACTN|nr:DUF305 domain-containing protein [Streptomyces subrutilus]OEJ34780.1 DUF305 domain-containing protein [Streptomyces subrutilus]
MSENRSLIRRTTAVAAAVAASLVLAACGGADGGATAGHGGHTAPSSRPQSLSPTASPSAARGQHNAADVAFAQMMIPHHRQAVEMADLAPTRAGSAEVKQLAEAIKKAQDPEIRTLSGWLTAWGEQVPATGAGDHSAHGAGGGMMTAEEMDRLGKASGKAFDTAFMELMIKHHEGAVAMAETERTQGAHPEAKTMAEAIISSQSAEIATMKELLGKN